MPHRYLVRIRLSPEHTHLLAPTSFGSPASPSPPLEAQSLPFTCGKTKLRKSSPPCRAHRLSVWVLITARRALKEKQVTQRATQMHSICKCAHTCATRCPPGMSSPLHLLEGLSKCLMISRVFSSQFQHSRCPQRQGPYINGLDIRKACSVPLPSERYEAEG